MRLKLLSNDDGWIFVACEGPVSQERMTRGADPLAALIGPEGYAQKVLFNLEQASFIDSSGIGWLVMCHKRCVQAGGRFVIYSAPPIVTTVLKLVQLPRIVSTAASENEARVMASANQDGE